MTFADVNAIAFHHEPVFFILVARMAESNRKLNAKPLTRAASNDEDLRCIGVIALLVVVGSELLLLLRTEEAVESMMADERHHMPTATHQLLDELLFHVRDRDLLENAKDEHFETIYRVEEASAGIERAKSGNGIIKKRLEAFKVHAEAHGDEHGRGDDLPSSHQEPL